MATALPSSLEPKYRSNYSLSLGVPMLSTCPRLEYHPFGMSPSPPALSHRHGRLPATPYFARMPSQNRFTGHHSPVTGIPMIGFARPHAQGRRFRVAHARVHHTVSVQRR
jgi:hypothetical protein